MTVFSMYLLNSVPSAVRLTRYVFFFQGNEVDGLLGRKVTIKEKETMKYPSSRKDWVLLSLKIVVDRPKYFWAIWILSSSKRDNIRQAKLTYAQTVTSWVLAHYNDCGKKVRWPWLAEPNSKRPMDPGSTLDNPSSYGTTNLGLFYASKIHWDSDNYH